MPPWNEARYPRPARISSRFARRPSQSRGATEPGRDCPQGRAPPVALQLYQAALTAHPKNARALAGYLGLSASRDPEGTESRLKTLLQEQADAPSLYFALGNLLAGQGRWHEAQAAYFQASSLDGSNPDYRFNLAVSLDQLRQGKPAADHYRQALEAAQHRPAAFDPTQVRTRLQILAGSAAP